MLTLILCSSAIKAPPALAAPREFPHVTSYVSGDRSVLHLAVLHE